jgi:ribose 5-phosphate isomerase B
MRRIHVGSDHAAVGLRLEVVAHLRDLGHSVTEVGPAEGERCDYPDHAATVARAVSDGTSDVGVLVCGTGIGVSIAANKIDGIRAALVHDITTAKFAAQHNNANVLCIGGRLLAPQLALELVDTWLETPFETRHQHRLDKITALERPTTGG